MATRTVTALASMFLFLAASALMLSGVFTSDASHGQATRLGLDMVASDDPTTTTVETANTYIPSIDEDFDGIPDPGSNVMSVGPIDNCFIHDAPGVNTAHLHGFPTTGDARVQLVLRNVEDSSGWQARLNMDGTKIAITAAGQINHTPYLDGTVPINFLNLPVDATGSHKSVFGAQDIQNPTLATHTVLLGSTALAVDNVGAASDTPSKAVSDETLPPPNVRSYQAETGGVVAQLQYVIRAGQAGMTNIFDVDDGNPNSPGSKVDIFTASGLLSHNFTEGELDDGSVNEGSTVCVPVDPTPAPTCFGATPSIIGTEGGETIPGTNGDDVIHGLGGNDSISGLGGNDKICGGDGDDQLDGGQGVDELDGGTGFDTCVDDAPTTMVSCEGIGDPTPSPTPSPSPGPITPTPTATATATPGAPTPTPPDNLIRTLDSPNSAALDFGRAVAMLDSDNDGKADITAGAPETAIGGTANLGQAYLFSGASGAALHTFDSPNPQTPGDAYFGLAVAMGDATGDGRADILVGAPFEDVNLNGGQGRAYLFNGASGVLLRTLDTPNPGSALNFGRAVAMGDVNADGLADMAIGSIGEDVAGNLDQGRAYVFSGANGALLLTLQSPNPSANALFGSSLAVGELSGDANGDVVVGAQNESTGGRGVQGRVYVFSGATGSLIRTIDNPSPNGAGRLGSSLALGEANGDGVLDIAVGAMTEDSGTGPSSGRAYLFSGATGTLLHTFNPLNPHNNQRFGETLAAGDVTGDGSADLLVAAPLEDIGLNNEQGRVYVFNGSTGTRLSIIDSPNPQAGGRFGQGMAMGDLAGDARREAAVGAPDENAGRGRVYVFGFTSVDTPTPPPTPTATATASPTATPCPDCIPSTEVTFVNDTGQSASELHIEFESTSTSTAGITQNAPGCPSPTVHSTPPHDFEVTVVWDTPCVDPGESVRFEFTADSPFSPKPEVSCFYWTRFGEFIEGQSPPCADIFLNETGQAASDLHVDVRTPFGDPARTVGLVQNAPGCPEPAYSIQGSTVDIDWGVACVDPGESAAFIFIPPDSARAPTSVESFSWTSGTPAPTPTPTPFPVAGHDARLFRIGGVPKNVRLSPGEVIADSASIVVANDGDHTETIGVYVDVTAPSGCTPSGRVLQTTVTLEAGKKTTLAVPVSYSCSDPSAADGQSYSWTAVADHGADDLAACGPGSLQALACFNALADDDEDPADNRKARTGPKVIAQ